MPGEETRLVGLPPWPVDPFRRPFYHNRDVPQTPAGHLTVLRALRTLNDFKNAVQAGSYALKKAQGYLRRKRIIVPPLISQTYKRLRYKKSPATAQTVIRKKSAMASRFSSSRRIRRPYRFKRTRRRVRRRMKRSYRTRASNPTKRLYRFVKRSLNRTRGYHCNYKYVTSNFTVGAYNKVGWKTLVVGGGITTIEAVLANLRTYDPGTNALVTTALATGTYHRDISVKVQSTVVFKNSASVPVHMDFYLCSPKTDTSLAPEDTITNGLNDQGTGLLIEQSWVHPKHSSQFKDLWYIKKHTRYTLGHGKNYTFTYQTPWFDYDPAMSDSHSDTYQKRFHSDNLLIRISADLSHNNDTSNLDEVVRAYVGVDYEHCRKIMVLYEAGKNIHEYSLDDQRPSTLTGAMPIAITGVFNSPDNITRTLT